MLLWLRKSLRYCYCNMNLGVTVIRLIDTGFGKTNCYSTPCDHHFRFGLCDALHRFHRNIFWWFTNKTRSRIMSLKECLALQNQTREPFCAGEYLQLMRSVAGEVSIIGNPISEDDLTLHIKPCFGQGQFVESGASRHVTSDLRNLPFILTTKSQMKSWSEVGQVWGISRHWFNHFDITRVLFFLITCSVFLSFQKNLISL